MEILQYEFFQKAIVIAILISLLWSLIWTLIVTRREVQIGHTISNFALLWIILSLASSLNSLVLAILLSIIWAILIFFMDKLKTITRDSVLEITSQLSLALGIFILWVIWNVNFDITSILFWNILSIKDSEFNIFFFITLILIIVIWVSYKKILAISINKELAKAFNINYNFYNLLFLISSAIFITFSIKLVWVLLISAFLIIPANIWKILANTNKQMIILAVSASIFSGVFWLFMSYFFNTSSGSSIVLVMWILLLLSVFLWKIKKRF